MAFSSRFDQISFAQLMARLHRRSGVLVVREPLEVKLEIRSGSVIKAYRADGPAQNSDLGRLLQQLLSLEVGEFTFYGEHILYDEAVLMQRLETQTLEVHPTASTQPDPNPAPDELFYKIKKQPTYLPMGEAATFWEQTQQLFEHKEGWSARELAKLTHISEQQVRQYLADLYALRFIQPVQLKEAKPQNKFRLRWQHLWLRAKQG